MHPFTAIWFALGFAACDLIAILATALRGCTLRPWLPLTVSFCLGILVGAW